MISVVLNANKGNGSLELHMRGHADSGEYGKDLICASASILAYTYAYEVDNKEPGFFLKEPIVSLEEGEANITCLTKTSDDFEEMLTIMSVIAHGFYVLMNEYPECVRIKLFGEAKSLI